MVWKDVWNAQNGKGVLLLLLLWCLNDVVFSLSPRGIVSVSCDIVCIYVVCVCVCIICIIYPIISYLVFFLSRFGSLVASRLIEVGIIA